MEMLKLAKKLNNLISPSSNLEDIQKQTKFVIETNVLPGLENLKNILKDTSKPWIRRIVDLALDAPELIGNFQTMIPNQKYKAYIEAFKRISKEVKEILDEKIQQKRILMNNGLSYLLKIDQIYKK